ncbi:1,2-phenylacetyl-CoA epoxidase subunit PaaC [Mumia zhuanghuii]|uniref:1,2-phenylacetyl-CoA epoxidase subunit PaaC n=1 Tax=Mumia zhuanghuii TaxID=2585211 RepID=UPI00362EC557
MISTGSTGGAGGSTGGAGGSTGGAGGSTGDVHDNPYEGLYGGDATHWAFGTAFEDPLATLGDTTVPDGVDPHDLASYAVMLADDALVMSHRLAQWCSNAPDLEEDVALANVALDLLGQARLLYTRAGTADPEGVPVLAEGSRAAAEDAFASFRDVGDFHNVALVEVENGDFADAVVRILLFATWRLALMERLRDSTDPVLAAIAAKAVKELTYHRDYAGRWVVVLAGGTDESRRRVLAARDALWPLRAELGATHPVEARMAESGAGVDPATVDDEVDDVLAQVWEAGGLDRLDRRSVGLDRLDRRTGRHGVHTEDLAKMLAEMQSVARAHPTGRW